MVISSTHDDGESQFLEAILAAPDDDAPRLVYADWLSERGDPRGELIQLQIRAAALEAGGDRNKVRAAENKLVEAHRAVFLGPLADRVERAEFRRGFLAQVKMSARAWLESADLVRVQAPLLEELYVVFEEGDSAAAQVFARPEMAGLRTLHIFARTPDQVRALAETTALTHVTSLQIDGVRLGVDEGAAIARADLPNLKSLAIQAGFDAGITPDVLAAIGAASFRLRKLQIVGAEWSPTPTALGVGGAELIVTSPAFSELKELELPHTGLGVDGVAPVLGLEMLEAIDVEGARIGPEGLDPLFAHPGLRRVSLVTNELRDEGTIRIARSPALARWTHLHLGSNDIGIDGVQALCDSPHARGLQVLNLSGNGRLRDRAIEVLLASPNLANARIWLRGFLARKKVPAALERKKRAAPTKK